MKKYLESETSELKSELKDAIKEEIVAFLNTEGGDIYVGVNDDGTVCSISENNKDLVSKKVAG